MCLSKKIWLCSFLFLRICDVLSRHKCRQYEWRTDSVCIVSSWLIDPNRFKLNETNCISPVQCFFKSSIALPWKLNYILYHGNSSLENANFSMERFKQFHLITCWKRSRQFIRILCTDKYCSSFGFFCLFYSNFWRALQRLIGHGRQSLENSIR